MAIKIIDYKEDGKSSKIHKLYKFIKSAKYSLSGNNGKDGIAKKNIITNFIIEQLDADGGILETWTLINAFINSVENAELSYDSETLSEITINVSYDEATLK